MSKTTFALIAGVSAASGAAVTAALFSSKAASRTTSNPSPLGAPSPSTVSQHQPPSFPPAAALGSNPAVAVSNTVNKTLAASQSPVDPSGVYQYGFPGPKTDLLTTLSTVSAFNRATRNPHWVAEHITPESLAMNNGNRRYAEFEEDKRIPEMFRARLKDYRGSGYDRGHQVPAADAKWSQDAMDDTFMLSNMCPQVGEGFNRDYWAHLEDFCRRLTGDFPSVRVITGPLYLPRRGPDGKWRVNYEVVGDPANVSVPTHFFKVVFAEDGKTGGNVSLAAFVLPNAHIDNKKPLTDFEVPLEQLERASGLTFASKLPAQRRRRLCGDVSCSLIVKEYNDRQKTFNKGGSAGRS